MELKGGFVFFFSPIHFLTLRSKSWSRKPTVSCKSQEFGKRLHLAVRLTTHILTDKGHAESRFFDVTFASVSILFI